MALDIDFTRRNKKPRPLSDMEKDKLDEFVDAIHYSARYACVCMRLPTFLLTIQPATRTVNTSTDMCNSRSRC
jgi:hypothetical protein